MTMDHYHEIDPKLLGDGGSESERPALVMVPRRGRKRFPENCVAEMESDEAARAAALGRNGSRPALVVGPFRSSEGFRIYYLVRWLD